MTDFGEIEIFSSATTVDVQDVETGRLEVSGGVVRFGNENLGIATVFFGIVEIGNCQKPVEIIGTFCYLKKQVLFNYILLLDGTQKIESRFNFRFGIVGFYGGRHHSDKPALGGHLMRVADHRYVNIYKNLQCVLMPTRKEEKVKKLPELRLTCFCGMII